MSETAHQSILKRDSNRERVNLPHGSNFPLNNCEKVFRILGAIVSDAMNPFAIISKKLMSNV